MTFAYTEFLVESYLFPTTKYNLQLYLAIISIPLALSGAILRLGAFYTARSNFHHLIRDEVEEGHILVTEGIYSWERHPGYLGFFTFSIFSQVLLGNPLSFLAFSYVLQSFFAKRIEYEEVTLIAIFGQEYIEYRKNVKCHIPYIDKKTVDEIK